MPTIVLLWIAHACLCMQGTDKCLLSAAPFSFGELLYRLRSSIGVCCYCDMVRRAALIAALSLQLRSVRLVFCIQTKADLCFYEMCIKQ